MLKTTINLIKNNIFIVLALIYFIWPFDLIPDIFITIGGPIVLLDDAGFILVAIIHKLYTYWSTNQPQTPYKQP